MIPVDEGNEECKKCEHYNSILGCLMTYTSIYHIGEFPSCGRDIEVSQKYLKEYLGKYLKEYFKRYFKELKLKEKIKLLLFIIS